MIRPYTPFPKYERKKTGEKKERNKMSNHQKSAWTESKLQEQQEKLHAVFSTCGWKTSPLLQTGEGYNVKQCCSICVNRQCDKHIVAIHGLLSPYAESIYKRHFKFRSTLEEMDRVITEAVNSLLMDIWERGKIIEKSFGKMVYWKMMYFLDGKINLFDRDNVQSLDKMKDEFHSNAANDEGQDIIEYYSEMFQGGSVTLDGYRHVLKRDTVTVITKLLEASFQHFNRYLNPSFKFGIYIRTLVAIKRFFQGKDNSVIFKGNPKAFYYYNKILDVIFNYLKTYSKNK
jgi:hypothetical protein